MSNFICSECGMTNIDCGWNCYKTPKEIELEQQVERLQEQKQKVIALIKDGRFVDALQLLEDK